MGNKRLILLRHAKSDWHSGAPTDFERPLNDRGSRDAPRVGRWMHFNNLKPDVICCSSALRTRQTMEGVSRELNITGAEIHFLGDLYHAIESEIIQIIERQLASHDTLLIIGHNPGLELTLMHYCPYTVVPEDRKIMTTACIAVIDFAGPVIESIGAGKLKFHRRPE